MASLQPPQKRRRQISRCVRTRPPPSRPCAAPAPTRRRPLAPRLAAPSPPGLPGRHESHGDPCAARPVSDKSSWFYLQPTLAMKGVQRERRASAEAWRREIGTAAMALSAWRVHGGRHRGAGIHSGGESRLQLRAAPPHQAGRHQWVTPPTPTGPPPPAGPPTLSGDGAPMLLCEASPQQRRSASCPPPGGWAAAAAAPDLGGRPSGGWGGEDVAMSAGGTAVDADRRPCVSPGLAWGPLWEWLLWVAGVRACAHELAMLWPGSQWPESGSIANGCVASPALHSPASLREGSLAACPPLACGRRHAWTRRAEAGGGGRSPAKVGGRLRASPPEVPPMKSPRTGAQGLESGELGRSRLAARRQAWEVGGRSV